VFEHRASPNRASNVTNNAQSFTVNGADGSLQAYQVGKGGYRVRTCDLVRFQSGSAPAPKKKHSRWQLRPSA